MEPPPEIMFSSERQVSSVSRDSSTGSEDRPLVMTLSWSHHCTSISGAPPSPLRESAVGLAEKLRDVCFVAGSRDEEFEIVLTIDWERRCMLANLERKMTGEIVNFRFGEREGGIDMVFSINVANGRERVTARDAGVMIRWLKGIETNNLPMYTQIMSVWSNRVVQALAKAVFAEAQAVHSVGFDSRRY